MVCFCSESLLIENTKPSLHQIMCKNIKTQTAQLVRTQRRNSQLLEINNSLSYWMLWIMCSVILNEPFMNMQGTARMRKLLPLKTKA